MKAIRVKGEAWGLAGVYYVRTEAMVMGFDVSLQGEFDTDTPDTGYVLVVDDRGKPLSTCRVNAPEDREYGKIERVATVSYARGKGAGRLAIEEAERWIEELGKQRIVITSRDEAVGFYEKLGYTADENKHIEPHVPDEAVKTEEDHSPHFVIVYMEKQLSS